MIKKIARKIYRLIVPRKKIENTLDYWEDRARKFGARSVLNLAHPDEEIDSVTERQVEAIFPILKQQLSGDEKAVLDFGCGVGRFSGRLADLIDGRVHAVDPIRSLLDNATPHPSVEYSQITDGKIAMPDDSVDVAWIALVFGGIRVPQLKQAAEEVARVLRPGGILCLTENTSNKPDGEHWYFRSVQFYNDLFPSVELVLKGSYQDVGEEIAIMTGRKQSRGA